MRAIAVVFAVFAAAPMAWWLATIPVRLSVMTPDELAMSAVLPLAISAFIALSGVVVALVLRALESRRS